MKIVFLDIDGVLCSWRTAFAYTGDKNIWPFDFDHMSMFDPTAIAMVQKLVKKHDAKVVVSSTWRSQFTYQQIGQAFDLPTIDSIPLTVRKRMSDTRGHQIQYWLDDHRGQVETYAILDDSNDMLLDQLPYFIRCCSDNGMTALNYKDLDAVLSGKRLKKPRTFGTLDDDSNYE